MKTLIRFSTLIAIGCAIAAFVLLMVSPAAYGVGALTNSVYTISGTEGIFGTENVGAPWAGLLAWIFVLVSMVALIALVVIEFLKVKIDERVIAVVSLLACALMVMGGVFAFLELSALEAAYGSNAWAAIVAASHPGLGAGWVIGAIVMIAGGAFAGLAPIVKLLKK